MSRLVEPKVKPKAADPLGRFVLADAPVKPRIIGASVGPPGTGKTSFWLSAPGPIVVFSFDKGLEGVVEKFQDQKEIRVAEYDWSPTADLSQDDAIELRDKVVEDFEYAVLNARTVIIDKETDMWELFRYAEFGAPNDQPRNYPQLNQRYRRLINIPKALDINFGVIQGMKAEWVASTNKKTGAKGATASGAFIRAGFGEIGGLVHVDLVHSYDKDSKTFIVEVGKARGPGGFDVQGESLPGLDFATFAQLVFPDSESSDWE